MNVTASGAVPLVGVPVNWSAREPVVTVMYPVRVWVLEPAAL